MPGEGKFPFNREILLAESYFMNGINGSKLENIQNTNCSGERESSHAKGCSHPAELAGNVRFIHMRKTPGSIRTNIPRIDCSAEPEPNQVANVTMFAYTE
eukprot:6178583-Pleurochrysis_carterae.AAC.2